MTRATQNKLEQQACGLQVMQSNDSEASRKGLYALATLLRNNAAARQHFYEKCGVSLLMKLLGEAKQPEAVQRKVLNLITDLSQEDLHSQVWRCCWQPCISQLHHCYVALQICMGYYHDRACACCVWYVCFLMCLCTADQQDSQTTASDCITPTCV